MLSIYFHHLTVPTALCPTEQKGGLLLFPFTDPNAFLDLQKAIAFAERVHKGEKRADGKPFLTHPLAAMRILAEASTRLPFKAYLAAVLHDVLEVDRMHFPQLLQEFGTEVAEIVWALTKPMKTPFCSGEEREKLYLAHMARVQNKHPETLLVKLADRIHNIETSIHLPSDRAENMLTETTLLYLPLLHECTRQAPAHLAQAYEILLSRLEQSIVQQRIALHH